MIVADKIVQTEQFKTVFPLVEIYFLFYWGKCHVCDLLDLCPDFLHFLFRHILVERLERKLITALELSVVSGILLDSVVRQMNEVVADVVRWILFSTCTDISLLEEEQFHLLGKQCPYSNVKLSALDKEWFLYVFLNHKRTIVELKFLLTGFLWCLLLSRIL